jgi:hypothetical protein
VSGCDDCAERAGLWRAAFEEGIDRRLNVPERLLRARRGLQLSPAINQKHRWVMRNVAIEMGDIPAEGEQRVTDRDLLHNFRCTSRSSSDSPNIMNP